MIIIPFLFMIVLGLDVPREYATIVSIVFAEMDRAGHWERVSMARFLFLAATLIIFM